MRVRNCIGAVVAWVTGIRARRLALAAIAAAVALTAVAVAVAAVEAAQSAEVTDPAGDTKNNAEPWQDVVRGRIVRQGDTFTFSQEMAAPLPANPPTAPGGLGWYFWDWGVNVDPGLAPAGWPFPKTHAAQQEFLVGFASDGVDYFAFVADRRPLVLGQDVIITPVPCRVDGAVIQVFVDADLLDDPAEFGWRCGSLILHAHIEADGYQRVDPTPNEPVWVPWPQN